MITVPDAPVRRRAGTGDETGRGLAVIDGLIAMYHGQRGCTDDDTGPGKTVYVVLQLIANAPGAGEDHWCGRPPGSRSAWQRLDAGWPVCSGRPGSGPPTGVCTPCEMLLRQAVPEIELPTEPIRK